MEVGLPEEVEVEAELVGDYKSKSLRPAHRQRPRPSAGCSLTTFHFPLCGPFQHSSQHRPALSSNQPPPPRHTVLVVVVLVVAVVVVVVVVVWQNCCSELSPRIPLASSTPILTDRDGVFSDDGQHTQGLQHRQGAHRAPGGAESAPGGGIQTQPGAEIHLCLETSHSI